MGWRGSFALGLAASLIGKAEPANGQSHPETVTVKIVPSRPVEARDAALIARPRLSTPDPSPGVPPRPSLPPLSIADALTSAQSVAARLEALGPATPSPRWLAAERARILEIIRYIRAVDDANPTLRYYQWRYIGGGKAEPNRDETDDFKPLQPIGHVTAVAFRVTRGDVRILRVRVHAKSGLVLEFALNKIIPANLPRREVCFLDTEITLDKVEVVYRQVSRQGDKDPRLKLDAGICSLPENGKKSIYHLMLASGELQRKKPAGALKQMKEAIRLLAAFRASRGL